MISCGAMSFGDKSTLKNHCVDIIKLSTNASRNSLLALFGLVVTNIQSTSLHFFGYVDF
jgi:hypothetical protein